MIMIVINWEKKKLRFKGGIKVRKVAVKNEDNIDCIFDHISNGFDINKVLEIFDTSLPVVFSPSWSSSKMKFNYSNFGEQAFLELGGMIKNIINKK